jgi:hypothetical protein
MFDTTQTEAATAETQAPKRRGKQKETIPAFYSQAHEAYFALPSEGRKSLGLSVANRQRLSKGLLPEGLGMVQLACAGLSIASFASAGQRPTSQGSPLRGTASGPKVSVFESSPVGQAIRVYMPSATIKRVAEILGATPGETMPHLKGETTPSLAQVRRAAAAGIPDTVWAEVPEAQAKAAERKAKAKAKAEAKKAQQAQA